MDIIVTTPKSQMKAAAQEAADCIAAAGGQYFRRFPLEAPPDISVGDSVFYVEDGYVRGYCVVSCMDRELRKVRCGTTGRLWPAGFYVFMDATSWTWIRPIRKRGFQGFRYRHRFPQLRAVVVVGNWLAPKPDVAKQGVQQ